ncbi:Rieske (2Fe-2S) protein [Pelomicrobium methylotrophicum]|uniref:Rieske 2Fe-2S domain-containing protein n=1 Tax=Pelomicrobium methylotrophicum TaxID=2602750 RepID=A0A5C7ESD0_9PROT|nr:Rieske 2Fe-2S domain-containing protein [Pelomicrobium methylotrophicum]TXF09812.1 Rieske 2Fe-2S domain-containing protein [Pelomicrobium methylotrophicum]
MNWFKLCKLDEVPPNEMRAFTVNGIEVIVLRGADSYLVIPPSCPHMANHLIDGFFDGCILTCNKHLWQWSIVDGQPLGEAERPLLTYEAQTRDGEIWVNLAQELLYEHEREAER